MSEFLDYLTGPKSPLGGLVSTTGIKKNVSDALVEYTQNALRNHTIFARYVKGDTLGEAVKNDFREDTIIGQLLQGKSFNEAQEAYLNNGSIKGAMSVAINATKETLESIFSEDNK